MWRAAGIVIAAAIAAVPTLASAQSDILQDKNLPETNAVVLFGGCSGALISDHVILTAAHCLGADLRAEQPPETPSSPCAKLGDQHKLQNHAWEEPFTWYEVSLRKKLGVRVGSKGKTPIFQSLIQAYAVPRCADFALLKITRRVPPTIATPMPAITRLPGGPGSETSFFLSNPVRYAGWGMPGKGQGGPKTKRVRNTGRVEYWSRNLCNLFTMPPVRPTGERILSGDSGSPLMVVYEGRRLVAGVLFGSGVPDHEVCGIPRAGVPKRHGSYTPTFRTGVPGTDATDIAEWLARMAPDAVIDLGPQATSN